MTNKETFIKNFPLVENFCLKTESFIKVMAGKIGHDGQNIFLDLEQNDGYLVADYYGEFRGGYPWVNSLVEKYAQNNGYTVEWVNPGMIGFYPN